MRANYKQSLYISCKTYEPHTKLENAKQNPTWLNFVIKSNYTFEKIFL